MTFARLRILAVHYSYFVIPAGYTAVLILMHATSNLPWAIRVAVGAPVAVAMGLSVVPVTQHEMRACARCVELEPRIARRYAAIPTARKRMKKQYNRHTLWTLGAGLMVAAWIVMFCAPFMPAYQYEALSNVGENLLAMSLWWVAVSLFLHRPYADSCFYCDQLRLRRQARTERRRARAESRRNG